MKKSELYAKYDNFNNGDIIEIPSHEYYELLNNAIVNNDNNISTIDAHIDGSTYIQTIHTDGMDYMMYSCTWNVGWQGDVDCDTFFCKKKTMSKVEREDLMKLFCSDAF